MKTGKKVFELQLTKIAALLTNAAKQNNPAMWLFLNDLRTPMFMLEALARIYMKVYGSKELEKCKEQFKALEDALGAVDYYAAFAKELAENKKVPAAVVDYLKEQTDKKIKQLNTILKDENWLNGKQLDKIYDTINDTNWKEDEKEVNGIKEFYIKAIKKVQEFVTETGYKFDNVEEDVHELRRKLRWLSIYPQALQGVFQYKKLNTKPTANLQKYLTDAIIKSPYNIMPATIAVQSPLHISKNYFLALSWTIAELGKLKDEGLRVVVVKEALQNTSLLQEEDAYIQTYKLLGKNQPTLETLLDKAEIIVEAFFKEGNLKKLFAD